MTKLATDLPTAKSTTDGSLRLSIFTPLILDFFTNEPVCSQTMVLWGDLRLSVHTSTLGKLHIHLNVFVDSRDPQCIVQTWCTETIVNGNNYSYATWNGEWELRYGPVLSILMASPVEQNLSLVGGALWPQRDLRRRALPSD